MVTVALNWQTLFDSTSQKFGGKPLPDGMAIVEADVAALELEMNKNQFNENDPLVQAANKLKA